MLVLVALGRLDILADASRFFAMVQEQETREVAAQIAAMTTFTMFFDFGALVGTYVVGLLAESFGFGAGFGLPGALCAAATAGNLTGACGACNEARGLWPLLPFLLLRSWASAPGERMVS